MSAPTREIFTYDLMSTLRKDPAKARKVQEGMQRIDNIQRQMGQGKADPNTLAKEMAALIPVCGFNFGLLIPHFFKKYPEDKPLSYIPRPFMFAMSSLANNGVVTLKAGRQVGKCADGDTIVVTDRGAMTLRELFYAGSAIP